MRELTDKSLLEAYLHKFRIRDLFDTPRLPFHLVEYAPGEMMNILRPTTDYIKFIVEGSFDLYTVLEDGSRHLIWCCTGYGFLGDLEFCGMQVPGRYQEVVTTVRTVELPLPALRETLLEDNRFLRFLLNTTAAKLRISLPMHPEFSTLEDSLLYYLRSECPNHTITSVEAAAFRLNRSRRQLQRVLKRLTERGILVKKGKGRYLLQETSPV